MGEHLPCKQGVRGSNPLISTEIWKDLSLYLENYTQKYLITKVKKETRRLERHPGMCESTYRNRKIPKERRTWPGCDATHPINPHRGLRKGQAKKSVGWMPRH